MFNCILKGGIMKHKINIIKVGNSLAVTTAVIYFICIIAVWVAPVFTIAIGNYLLHGVDITKLVTERSFVFSVISLVIGTVMAWLTGALFAIIYNKLE